MVVVTSAKWRPQPTALRNDAWLCTSGEWQDGRSDCCATANHGGVALMKSRTIFDELFPTSTDEHSFGVLCYPKSTNTMKFSTCSRISHHEHTLLFRCGQSQVCSGRLSRPDGIAQSVDLEQAAHAKLSKPLLPRGCTRDLSVGAASSFGVAGRTCGLFVPIEVTACLMSIHGTRASARRHTTSFKLLEEVTREVRSSRTFTRVEISGVRPSRPLSHSDRA